MSCDLSLNLTFDCTSPESAVVKDTVYLLPYDSLDSSDLIYNVTDAFQLDSIGLVTGSEAVKYAVAPDTVIATIANVAGANGVNGFSHSVALTIPTKTAAAREEVRLLNNKKVVLVLQSGSGEFLVYGLDAGLKISELANTRGDENGDVVTLTMATAEGRKEPTMEITLLATDEAGTVTLLENLLTTQV